MEPPAKEIRDSVRGTLPNSVGMDVHELEVFEAGDLGHLPRGLLLTGAFQISSRRGSRDGLTLSDPMEPSAKTFRESVRGTLANRVGMDVYNTLKKA